MKRRLALLVACSAVLALVATASGAPRLQGGVVGSAARLLCGCDVHAATRAAVSQVRTSMSTVSMSIVHTVRGCHVWALRGRQLGPRTKLVVKPGTRLKLRIDCPMDFDLRQVAGPRLALGSRRYYTGTTRVIVFRKRGTYRIVGVNVQSSEEVGLQTLGADNTVTLVVRVR